MIAMCVRGGLWVHTVECVSFLAIVMKKNPYTKFLLYFFFVFRGKKLFYMRLAVPLFIFPFFFNSEKATFYV